VIEIIFMSKQSEWQARKKALGFCIKCGKRPLFTTVLCNTCYEKAIQYRREFDGWEAWKPGGSGQAPRFTKL